MQNPYNTCRHHDAFVCFLFRLLSQCTEYFDLRCQLLDDLTSKPQMHISKYEVLSQIEALLQCRAFRMQFHHLKASESRNFFQLICFPIPCFLGPPSPNLSPPQASEMEVLKVSAATMLEDEISWLDNFEPSWSSEMETSEADNILLAGHLRLIKTLLSLCGNEKEHLGEAMQSIHACMHACISAPIKCILQVYLGHKCHVML